MCGISLLLQRIKIQNLELLSQFETSQSSRSDPQQKLGDIDIDFSTYLRRRGPDSFKTHSVHINDTLLSFSGAVLHLRGTEMNAQPLIDSDGNILLWNGEVFDGIDMKQNDNDTMQILKLFNKFAVFKVLDSIEGPFAFIYYLKQRNEIWFGRDCFGRRSLLFSFNPNTECFALSSVANNDNQKWNEITNRGIFCLSLNSDHNNNGFKLKEYSWNNKFNNKLSSFSNIKYEEIMNAFLNVLSRSIKKRILIPESSKLLRHKYVQNSTQKWINSVFFTRNCETRNDLNKEWLNQQKDNMKMSESSIGILYSGGIDSQIMTALCDKLLPPSQSIDLINVVCGDNAMLSPDRLTAINGLLELKQCINPNRNWRLIQVNIGYDEICDSKEHILSLIYPRNTVMDFNIGNILWFGSRAIGLVNTTEYKWIANNRLIRYAHVDRERKQRFDDRMSSIDIGSIVKCRMEIEFKDKIKNDHLMRKQKRKRAKEIKREITEKIKSEIYEEKEVKTSDELECDFELYISSARVLLLGFGADELLCGYGRHRTAFKRKGMDGLKEELNKDFKRLWKRNLGRDDRLISDHGRESRWPFLDEEFVSFVKTLPLEYICDLNEDIGFGDKKILRDCAKYIGLKHSWSLKKRAIQFGSRIANNKCAGYCNIDDDLAINDLINYEIYNRDNAQDHKVNIKITKKYNKKNGKNGYK